MRTQLTVQQIYDLGGSDLLKKILEFNGIYDNPIDLESEGKLPSDKVFTFDSTFKKEKIDLNKKKIYIYDIGKYDEKYNGIIIADPEEPKKNLIKKLKLKYDWVSTIHEDSIVEFNPDEIDPDGFFQI